MQSHWQLLYSCTQAVCGHVLPCFNSAAVTETWLLQLRFGGRAVGRSVGFHGQDSSRSPPGGGAARPHRCQSAHPAASSSGTASRLAARMRVQSAGPTRSSHYAVDTETGPVGRSPVDSPHDATTASEGSWERRAEQRMRVEVLVQSAAKEQQRLKSGRLSHSQLRRFWALQPSVHSILHALAQACSNRPP